MKNIFYNIWNDFKRSKFFTILFCLEILAVILVAAAFMTLATAENNYAKLYDASTKDLTIVSLDDPTSFDNTTSLEDFYDKTGFENSAFASNYFTRIGNVSVINKTAADWFGVKHTGAWFSGDETQVYSEALISPSLKKTYPLGGVYDIEVIDNVLSKIKVIGFLDGKDTAIALSGKSYNNVYSERKMLILDSRLIKTPSVKCVVTSGYTPQFYADNYSLSCITLKQSFDAYKSDTKLNRHYSSLILGLVFSLVAACILCNSIFKTEHDIKRNMLKFIVGNSNKNIVVSEILKCSAIFVLPFLLALGINSAMRLAAIAKKTIPLIGWGNFFISSSVVLGVYILATAFSLVRVIRAKPLKELRRIL